MSGGAEEMAAIEQRCTVIIARASEAFDNAVWRMWADRWLSGEDRSRESAHAMAEMTAGIVMATEKMQHMWGIAAIRGKAADLAHDAATAAGRVSGAREALERRGEGCETRKEISEALKTIQRAEEAIGNETR